MEDDEQSPSVEDDSASNVTVLPAGGDWSGIPPVTANSEPPEGANIVATLDLERQLDPNVSWVCLGLDRQTGAVRTLIPDGDWPSPFELQGFLDMVVNKDFVISQLNKGGDNG
jgi:hypothetical protein